MLALAAEPTGAQRSAKRSVDKTPETRVVAVPDTSIQLKLWEAAHPVNGQVVPHYSISFNGESFSAARATSYDLKLVAGDFDPLAAEQGPAVHPVLSAGADVNLYVVQFVTQPLEAFREQIRDLGGTVRFFLANHSHIVQMSPETRAAVAELPYVRWIGPYEPGYRVEKLMRDNVDRADQLFPILRYNIMVMDPELKDDVAGRIAEMGGVVDKADAGKFLVTATLTADQLFELARWDEVLFVDRWGPYEKDMDKSRILSGADYVETVAGYTGTGVRGEVFDAGFNQGHVDFASRPLIVHNTVGVDSHGAATSGICFGDGTGNPAARGILPSGQGIIADYSTVGLEYTTSRYNHTGELLTPPYEAVFQTSSVGSPRTSEYTTISADADAALFDFDIVHCQSQSNAGNQQSRPQAWAKNMISGGGVNHYDTLTKDDDCWCSGGSTGPATDGRIKPDMCHFYDDTLTTTTGSSTSYTTSFGGTSGATPNICGYTGLFHEMWADGIFNNDIVPGTVFDNRPHMTTAKAAMINTSTQYPFSGAGHDLGRHHQGWGMPDMQYMYDIREKMLVIDETDVLTNLSSASYNVGVNAGQAKLKATLVYADPPGVPSSSQHRINDLTLKVTDPGGTVYWGNNGLVENMWSTPGGAANTVDTVENVFIENPTPGSWTVEVIASEINQDSHVETPSLDADFALVVTGGTLGPGFALSATPGLAEVCAPDNAQFDIGITQFEGFVEPVLFTTNGLPAGATATFTAKNVVPPGSTSLIISDTDLATPGQHVIEIVGTTPSLTKSNFVTLDLSTAIPGDVALVDPTNGETEVGRMPDMIWTASTQGTSYDLEISTNPGFSGLAYSANVTGNSHTVATNLLSLTTYYWRVRANNGCGSGNDSPVFSFQTLEQPDYFTEDFNDASNDLDGLSVAFIPDGTGDYYEPCLTEITALPTDPAGGNVLTLTDDSSASFGTGFQPVLLYGQPYTTAHVGSNGYVTFTAGDNDYTETLADHFDLPRVSGLFDDLNPATGGTVSWKQDAEGIAVTWDAVPEYSSSNANTFQIEMFFNGRIDISWLNVDASDGITGLSAGNGVPTDYVETDHSVAPDCNATCFGDLDGSGDIGFGDILDIIGAWGPCVGCPEDLDTSGDVGFGDILIVIGVWGPC
ncbi:MAG: S8 family serine peptidase [Planctomycetes bacterium]|nr:S8 family serine peptidase [Planctomycetota bacterium]